TKKAGPSVFRKQCEHAQTIESVLDIGAIVPSVTAEAAAGLGERSCIHANGGGIKLVESAKLSESPAAGERGQQVAGWDAAVGAQAAFRAAHFDEESAQACCQLGRETAIAEELQQTDRGCRRVSAAALHRRQLDVAPIFATPALHKRRKLFRLRQRFPQKL